MKKKNELPTAVELKSVIWSTIEGVRAGKVGLQKANTVFSGSRSFCSVVNMELKAARTENVNDEMKTFANLKVKQKTKRKKK